MPLAGIGIALGRKAIEKVSDAARDAAMDALKAPRARSPKRSRKVQSKGKAGWVIPLVVAVIVLLFLMSH